MRRTIPGLVTALALGHLLIACDAGQRFGAGPEAAPDSAGAAGGSDDTGLGEPPDATTVTTDAAVDASAQPDVCDGPDCGEASKCEGVTCDTPPGPCYLPKGLCQAGICEYAVADGILCDDADPCTTDDTCDAGVCAGLPLPCDAPAAPACGDDGALTVEQGPGHCEGGACTYATTIVPCELGCEDSACVGDPCKGVVCDEPPGPCYSPQGTCSSGTCSYAPKTGAACDDGDPCTSKDACQEGACLGAAVSCDEPPGPSCLNAKTLRTYASPGVCSVGACEYDTTDTTCPGLCVDGSCATDPCAGVTCASPPGPCYEKAGSCVAGQCVYAPAAKACDDGDPCTADDACADGDCLGTPIGCQDPPASMCADEATLVVYSKSGVCDGGACTYAEVEVPCPEGCQDDACVGDPCLGVTCDVPPGPCYAETGGCEDGACSYALLDGAACDDGDACTVEDTCQAGLCKGKPKACKTPPLPSCMGELTQLLYAAVGTCAPGGECVYAETTKACQLACKAGACTEDPCNEVVCESNQDPCFEATGTCEGGACSYAYADGATCSDGLACTTSDACESGACAGTPVPCATPPLPTCADEVFLTTHAPVGTCSEETETCVYAEVPVSCPFGCVDGACAGDPCAGVVCESPDPPACSSLGTLRTSSLPGTCTNGVCEYVTADAPCPYGCQDGACLEPEGVVISEILYDSAGADTDTFVELHGPAGTPLDGYTLYGVDGSGGGTYQSISLTGTIGGDGLYVVGHPDATAWIKGVADQLDKKVDYQNGPDSVVLAKDGVAVDAVAYGNFALWETSAGEGKPAAVAPTGQSLARDDGYTDTDDNEADFQAFAQPTPGAPNVLTCLPGELACDGVCVDPQISHEHCGATTCEVAPCGDTEMCVAGACVPACADACAPGEAKCKGQLVQHCQLGATGCLDWGTAALCPGGGTCSGGGECGMVVSKSQELCGEVVVSGPFSVQGGATITCPSGELTIRAKTILVDQASAIDLSASSDEPSGLDFGFCTGPCNGNGIATGASGGGNGTAGATGKSTELEVKLSGSCGTPWGWTCSQCESPAGGAERDETTSIVVSRGGKGGDGCKTPVSGTGACDPADVLPGGRGGGVVRLIAEGQVTVHGEVRADGEDAVGSNQFRAGPGGGAGGSILLYAPKVVATGLMSAAGGKGGDGKAPYTGKCDLLNASGGNGGAGRVKILHGGTLDLFGTVIKAGVQTISYAPPLEIHSTTHPDPTLTYNDGFTDLTVEWTPPFPGVVGTWALVSMDPVVALAPGTGTYTTGSTLTIPATTFTSAGTWYIHLLSVGPGEAAGTVSSRFTFKINTLPPSVVSSSHPDQDAWYSQTTLAFAFAPPGAMDPQSVGGIWVRLDHSSATPPGKAGDGFGFTQDSQIQLTKDWQGKPLGPGTYYLHAVTEDTLGKLTKKASSYRVQLGVEPGKASLYGTVDTAAGSPLSYAVLTLEPYGLTATTAKSGFYHFDDVYKGTYTLTVTHPEHPTFVTQVEVGPAAPFHFTIE